MPEIRVERFATRDREKDGRRDGATNGRVTEQEVNGVPGVHSDQDAWVVQNLAQPQSADHQKPQQHNRAEESPDAAGPVPLTRKQGNQHDDRQRYNRFGEVGVRQLESFYRR